MSSPAITLHSPLSQRDIPPADHFDPYLVPFPRSEAEIYSDVRAACCVASCLSSFLGRRNIFSSKKSSTLPYARQSGAEILLSLNITHPAGRRIVQLAQKQFDETGDGSKTAVLLAGALLEAAVRLMKDECISVETIAENFTELADYAVEIVTKNSQRVDITDPNNLMNLCKAWMQSSTPHADTVAKLAMNAIMELDEQGSNEDLSSIPDIRNIHIVTEESGSIEDSQSFPGLIIKRRKAGMSVPECAGPEENVRVAILRYWMVSSILGNSYTEEEREELLREDRKRLLNDCKLIKKAGAEVVLISSRYDAKDGNFNSNTTNEEEEVDASLQICLHFLTKMGITVITDLDLRSIESVAKALGGNLARPNEITAQDLGYAKRVEMVESPSGHSLLHISTVAPCVTIVMHGNRRNEMLESKRNIHSALRFIGTLFEDSRICFGGGGAAEMGAALALARKAAGNEFDESKSKCTKAFSSALEIIFATLALNSSENSAEVIREMRRMHFEGQAAPGLDVGKMGAIRDMSNEYSTSHILSVLISAIQLATATSCDLLRQ